MEALSNIDWKGIGETIGSVGESIGTVTKEMLRLQLMVVTAIGVMAQYQTTLTVIKYTLLAVAFALGWIAAILVIIGALLALGAFSIFMALGGWILVALAALMAFGAYLYSLTDEIEAMDWVGTGGNLVQGLINGITAKIPDAVAAVTLLGASLATALAGVLQLGSPSKLTEKFGGWTADGLVNGMEGGKAEVAGSAASMASSVASGTLGGLSGAGGGGGGIRVESLVINANGSAAEDIKNAVLEAFEQLAIEMGAMPRTA
jgi:hypothetical protein